MTGRDNQGCIIPWAQDVQRQPSPITDELLLIGPKEYHEVRFNKNTHEWRYDKATETESEVTIVISPKE